VINALIDFICFCIWLALLILSGIFAGLSLICCAPVMLLTWISKQLSNVAEGME
jgi:hypothetical protein